MGVVSHAQNGEDLQIAYFVGRKSGATYIDVGCLWPEAHSNSFFFYERGGFGLCVDPNPTIAAEFRRQRPRDTFVNCGIGSVSEELTYYVHGNPVFNTFCPRVSRERVDEAARRQGSQRAGRELVDTVTIPVRTLQEIVRVDGFAERVGGAVDFLSIDVEGLELDVVRGYRFDVVRPRLVVVEHVRRRREPLMPEQLPVSGHLREHGYWLAGYTGHDLYFLDG